MGTAPAFASVSEAMDMARAALGYLAAADATALAAATQAECLAGLEQTDAISTAVRASFLSAFTAGQGYSADAHYSPRAWLIHHTRVTKGVAVAHTAWASAHRDASAGGGGAGRRGPVGILRPHNLPVDGQAAAGLPPGRGRDLAVGRQCRDGPAGPGRAGRGDVPAVPPTCRTRTRPGHPRTAQYTWRRRSRAPG